jgi:hypothetical protein
MTEVAAAEERHETTCPQCWLDPLEVGPGGKVPMEFGPVGGRPVGVDCPECGTIYFEEQPESKSGGPSRGEILECWHEDRKRGERGGGSGNKGPRRENVPPNPIRMDQAWPGFPERYADGQKSETINPMAAPIYATITREVDDWLQASMVAYRMTQSDFIRLCLEWARRQAPEVDGKNLSSQWKQRKRICFCLRTNEKPTLTSMAASAGVVRLGHYVAMILDILRRRPSLRRGLEEIREDSLRTFL